MASIGKLTITVRFKIEVTLLDAIKMRIMGKYNSKPIIDHIVEKLDEVSSV